MDVNENTALRVNASYESLENHRDFFDGDRLGINPTLKLQLSEATTIDLSYEYLDHERFIDRGIPTGANGRPVEAFEDIVFGDPPNITELEAHLLKAMMQHRFSDDIKGNFSAFYGDYDKLYQNFYASGYDQAATPDQVTLDGYLDTTQRENLILSGNIVAELAVGSLTHTLLFGRSTLIRLQSRSIQRLLGYDLGRQRSLCGKSPARAVSRCWRECRRRCDP